MKRFACHSESDILAKRANVIPNNTKKSNTLAAVLLHDYLKEKGQDGDFENFDSVRLSEVLCHFYVDLRTKDGDLYKVTTMESIRHGLNRYLKAPLHVKKFDIIKDAAFVDANECFKTAILEAKSLGKGEVSHKEIINSSDRDKLYSSIHLNPDTPVGLANKVQFDIRLYFFRRGAENMDIMTKDTFEIVKDQDTGLRYVKQTTGELTKNHREDKEAFGACMPELPGYDMCPVRSFSRYLAKLNPDSERLWQYPKESFNPDDESWYTKRPLGKNTLGKFMSTLSETCGLSARYTNHCIRATGATVLTRSNFASSQIMSVTGHKSVSSLTSYQKTSTLEKIHMGRALAQSMHPSSSGVKALANITNHKAAVCDVSNRERSVQPVSTSSSSENALDILQDVDLDNLFCEFDSMSNTSSQVQMNSNASMFQNCKIGTINLIVKK